MTHLDPEATGLAGPRGRTGRTGKSGEGSRQMILVLLAGAFVVTALGIQMIWFQNQESDHDEVTKVCTKEWADGMRETANLARSYTKELEDALERRNEALDAIILDVVDFQEVPEDQEPPQPLIEDFKADLGEFVAARENLVKVKDSVDEQRAENPYPVLDLGCAAGQEAIQ